MKIRIEEDILSGTGAEIMDQLRARVFDPTEFPDTESYIWFKVKRRRWRRRVGY